MVLTGKETAFHVRAMESSSGKTGASSSPLTAANS
jgi:hypothetical protein